MHIFHLCSWIVVASFSISTRHLECISRHSVCWVCLLYFVLSVFPSVKWEQQWHLPLRTREDIVSSKLPPYGEHAVNVDNHSRYSCQMEAKIQARRREQNERWLMKKTQRFPEIGIESLVNVCPERSQKQQGGSYPYLIQEGLYSKCYTEW